MGFAGGSAGTSGSASFLRGALDRGAISFSTLVIASMYFDTTAKSISWSSHYIYRHYNRDDKEKVFVRFFS
jgi:hypothetical protein